MALKPEEVTSIIKKELEKYSKIDYKTLSEDDRKKIFDDFVRALQKDTLYLLRGKLKVSQKMKK